MIPRYIIRPRSILTTPLLLKEALNARLTLAYPGSAYRKASYERDFFLAYPPESEISLSSHDYRTARSFVAGSKPHQRQLLVRSDLPVPQTFTTPESAGRTYHSLGSARPLIVRPHRHSQGIGWRITRDPTDFDPSSEYIQILYPKNHEYRVIAVRGVPLITMVKRVPEGLPRSQPWNHANGSSFVTVTDPDLDRLRHTDVYEKIRSADLFKHLDLVGIDILYRRRNEYAISEVNACPALQIAANIEKVARYVHSLPRSR